MGQPRLRSETRRLGAAAVSGQADLVPGHALVPIASMAIMVVITTVIISAIATLCRVTPHHPRRPSMYARHVKRFFVVRPTSTRRRLLLERRMFSGLQV